MDEQDPQGDGAGPLSVADLFRAAQIGGAAGQQAHQQAVQAAQEADAQPDEHEPMTPADWFKYISKPSNLQRAGQLASRFAAGATGTLGSMAEGVALPFGFGDQAHQLTQRATRGVLEMQPMNRALREDKGALTQHAESLGSATGFLAPALLGRGAGLRIPGALGTLGELGAELGVAAAGAASQASQLFYEAKGAGATDAQAWSAYALGLGVGATEALPLAGFLGRINDRSGGALQRIIGSMMVTGEQEGLQEAGQQALSNVVAKFTFDEERPVMQDVLKNARLGTVTGAILAGLGSTAVEVAGTLEAPAEPSAADGGVSSERPSSPDAAGGEALGQAGPTVLTAAQGEAVRHFGAAQGVEAKVVEPRSGAQRRVQETFRKRGGDAVFVETPPGREKARSAMYHRGSRTAVFDVGTDEKALEQRVALHEVFHHVREVEGELAQSRRDEGLGGWQEVHDVIKQLDPDGMAAVEREVATKYRDAGVQLDAKGLADETVGNYLQDIGGLLHEAPTFKRALEQRSLAVRILDGLARGLKKLGLPVRTATEFHVEQMRKRLAGTPLERFVDPKILPELHRVVQGALDALVGYRAPTKAATVSPAPAGHAGATATAEASLTAPTPSAAPSGKMRPTAASTGSAGAATQPDGTGPQEKRARQRENRAKAKAVQAALLRAAGKETEAQAAESEAARLRSPQRGETTRREDRRTEEDAAERHEDRFALRKEHEPVGYRIVAQHLSEAETTNLKRHTAKKLVEIFKSLPSTKDFVAAAQAGVAKKGWYENSARALRDIFGADAPRFAALLAATSPQTGVLSNLVYTLRVWRTWNAEGRPQDPKMIRRIMKRALGAKLGSFGARVPNAITALISADPASTVLSGPKVDSFMKNLVDHVAAATLDTWMAHFGGVAQTLFAGGKTKTPGSKRPGYLAMTAKVRAAAKELGWTPREVQETIWSWSKALLEQAKEEGRSAVDIVKQEGGPESERISGVPDFSRLFAYDPRIAEELKAAGYAPLVNLIEDVAPWDAPAGSEQAGGVGGQAVAAGEAGGPVLPAPSHALVRSARRLEGVRQAWLNAKTEAGRAIIKEHDAMEERFALRPPHPASEEIRSQADEYARANGISYNHPRGEWVDVNVSRAQRIADAFEAAQREPENPTVRAAYDALKRETLAQYDFLVSRGAQMVPMAGKGEPYPTSEAALRDIRTNKRLLYFKTINPEDEASFGQKAPSEQDNPLLLSAGRPVKDTAGNIHDQTYNDLFRAIHDWFGHATEGYTFGPRGEENAWRLHARMFSPLARAALTTETRGQNSWVNFGPHLRRADGSVPSPADSDWVPLPERPFAEQKITLLPPEYWQTDGDRFALAATAVGFGAGAPRNQTHGEYTALPITGQAEVTRALSERASPIAQRIAGVEQRGVAHGMGGWQTFPAEPSAVFDVEGTPEQVAHYARAMGHLLQQSAVYVEEKKPDGGRFIVDVAGDALSDAELVADFWRRLVEADPEIATGYHPIEGGIRIGRSAGDAAEQKIITARLIPLIRRTSVELGIDSSVDVGRADISEIANDWTQHPQGQLYVQGLLEAGRPSVQDELGRGGQELDAELTRLIAQQRQAQGQVAFAARPTPGDVERVRALQAQAAGEGESSELGGTPAEHRAIPVKAAVERALYRGVDAWRDENGRPTVISHEEQEKRAAEAMQSFDAQALVRTKLTSGAPMDPHEHVMAARLIHEKMLDAMRSGPAGGAFVQALEMVDQLREIRANTARSLGVLQDVVRSPREELMEGIVEPPPQARDRMQRAKAQSKDPARTPDQRELAIKMLERLRRVEAARFGKVQEALGKAGLDPYRLSDAQLADPEVRRNIAQVAGAAKATWQDKLIEYRHGMMLSGPLTHKANAVGNAANIAINQHGQRFIESLVNSVVRGGDAASVGELKAFYGAFFRSLRKAGSNFLQSWRTERDAYEANLIANGFNIAELGLKHDTWWGPAIAGTKGRVIRTGLRALTASDSLFKTLAGLPERSALAYRAAKKEGHSGAALTQRMNEILEDVTHPVHAEAHQRTLRLLFQNAPKKVSQGGTRADEVLLLAMTARKTLDDVGLGIAGRMILPYINTPFRIFEEGLKLPLAPVGLIGKGLMGKYRGNRSAMARDLARSLIGISIGLEIMHLMWGEDDEGRPLLTGSGQPYEASRSAMEQRTVPPYHVKLFGAYRDYARVEPLAVTVGTLADLAKAAKTDANVGLTLLRSVVAQSADKTFLQTWGDIYDALTRPEIEGGKILRDTLVMPMWPNAVRQPLREMDPYIRANTLRKYEDSALATTESAVKSIPYSALPVAGLAPPIRYDLWGRPMTRFDSNRSPLGRFAMKVLMPLPAEDMDEFHEIDRALSQWNETASEDEKFYGPAAPRTYTTVAGERVYYTDAEYERLTRDSGRRSAERILRKLHNGKPLNADLIKEIRSEIESARSEVSKEILQERGFRKKGSTWLKPALAAR